MTVVVPLIVHVEMKMVNVDALQIKNAIIVLVDAAVNIK
jgi:hypothetical protein